MSGPRPLSFGCDQGGGLTQPDDRRLSSTSNSSSGRNQLQRPRPARRGRVVHGEGAALAGGHGRAAQPVETRCGSSTAR